MNLQPEIKSAEVWAKAVTKLVSRCADEKSIHNILTVSLSKRDLAIWNAAIEKAAEEVLMHSVGIRTVNYGTPDEYKAYQYRGNMKQAILNLKRKE